MFKGKKLLRVVSSLCAASIAATLLCTTSVSAATVRKAGDVDGDGVVSIVDATMVQRYLVGLSKLDSVALRAADADFNGSVDICDVTTIQRYVAKVTTEITPLLDTKWTSLGSSSTKTVRFKSALAASRVEVVKPVSWIMTSVVKDSKGNVTGVKLTTAKNPKTKARKATVKIKVDGNEYKVSVKQMMIPETDGWDACYTYAMQLNTDPRANIEKPFDYNKNNPGIPGRISGRKDLSKFTIDQFNIIKDKNYLKNFEKYAMKYVKADLDTLGWGIKKASSATASVKSGDWLVCLTLNPSEYISTDDELIYARNSSSGAPINSEDYHWYRRSGSSGNYTWSHKRGQTAVLTLAKNKTPMNYDSKNNPIILLSDSAKYDKAMSGYVNYYKKLKKLFDEGKYRADPEEYDQAFVCAYTPGKDYSDIDFYAENYILVGYYEVGPNAF